MLLFIQRHSSTRDKISKISTNKKNRKSKQSLIKLDLKTMNPTRKRQNLSNRKNKTRVKKKANNKRSHK